MGGGWCKDEAGCVSRSKILLGSSKLWTAQLSQLWAPEYAGFYGLMDANETNPFGDWNFVWPAYCDGTSQTSDRAAPLVVDDGGDGSVMNEDHLGSESHYYCC